MFESSGCKRRKPLVVYIHRSISSPLTYSQYCWPVSTANTHHKEMNPTGAPHTLVCPDWSLCHNRHLSAPLSASVTAATDSPLCSLACIFSLAPPLPPLTCSTLAFCNKSVKSNHSYLSQQIWKVLLLQIQPPLMTLKAVSAVQTHRARYLRSASAAFHQQLTQQGSKWTHYLTSTQLLLLSLPMNHCLLQCFSMKDNFSLWRNPMGVLSFCLLNSAYISLIHAQWRAHVKLLFIFS